MGSQSLRRLQKPMKDFWEADPPGLAQITGLHWSFEHYARVLATAVRGKRVLEIGCGGGALSQYLARNGATVLAIDFSEKMISSARRNVDSTMTGEFRCVDILEFVPSEPFDIVCGLATLHEVALGDYPILMGVLDECLGSRGFAYFQENSFFNPLYRFVRRRIIGRYGTAKLGSDSETPLDRRRYEALRRHFVFCERSCDTFVAFERLTCQMLPRWPTLFKIGTGLDRAISRAGDNIFSRSWSYHQNIYFSNCVDKKAALPQATSYSAECL